VGLLSIDFRGAFDHLKWQYIKDQLATCDLPQEILGVLDSYLWDRRAEIQTGQGPVCREIQRGCAQGSVLGPVLWNLALDPLLRDLEAEQLQVIAYVDDVAIMIEANTKTALEEKAAMALRRIEEWTRPAGVDISYEKSAFVLVKGKLARRSPPVIRFNGRSIKVKDEIRYLGITIGTRLAYAPLATDRYDAAMAKLNSLKSLGGATWGLDYRKKRLLYVTVIKPVLLYGVEAWGPGMPKYAINKIKQAHRRALIWVAAGYRTLPYLAVCVLVGEPPIELLIKKRCGLAAMRAARNSEERDLERLEADILDAWQDMWTASSVGRHTYDLFPSIRRRLAYRHIHLDFVTTQYLTGHGDFAAKLCEWRKREFPMCECGEAEETAAHVIRDCPRYARARMVAEYEGLNFAMPETLTTRKNYGTFVKLCRSIARSKNVEAQNCDR